MNSDNTSSSGASQDAAGESLAAPPQAVVPCQIGRYQIERLLGQGGFGLVYLANDDQLQRLVAIKVPRQRVAPEDAVAYLTEARTAARLDHPNIVPVYDVGSTPDCPCFIVSRYIEGIPLTERIKSSRPTSGESAELVATIADALHYAHRKQVIHRDVKPGNILIDAAGMPFVVDFGLASKEDQTGKGLRYAGTPAYMSPEQARGEGHRVDGRSDIFSLGVVFYELLTGRLPFTGDSKAELLEQVRSFEPRPPRQHDDGIPKELERICMKALSKRASERYSTAKDLAEDLRHWVSTQSGVKVRPTSTAAGLSPAPSLGKDIFLSHATPDKETADRLCKLIEAQGVQCWIAPRDVMPGDDYGKSVIRAIEGTSVTALLLSSHANESIHVKNEVERATSKRKRVIPIRLEDVLPNESLELHLSTAQWMDAASLGLDQVALRLVQLVKGENSKAATPSRVAPSSSNPSSNSGRLHIVPKGLRSFDAHDADFFLELLPGPRDREGLPDSIRFWKTRIEETDADNTFAVGLIYGPSGCGKSSLVKAGLLPRLSESVISAYVEATAEETEARLLNGLRKRCPTVPTNLNLVETLAALRRGQGIPAGRKVLIVLDQFEQWLHSRKDEPGTELVQALRQCDGRRVQCIVMVRDDFWMAATLFMRDLEIRLLEGQNSAAVHLFDTNHARKVLAAFGRAFGTMPENSGELDDESKQFLNQAVSGLAQDNKIVSVRLALFAEMMKGRPWTLAALKEVGGTEGVGVTFLEETFSAATAPPEHRFHQKAARAVLKSLLPESGTDIKGHMRPQAELLEASDYAGRPKDFDDLIRILDSEIRLLTPTDPEGKDGGEDSATPARPGTKYYQLTHDYLVPALRDWLTRKQKETRRGRAELLLADRAGVWNARQESRQLPSLRQWLSVRFLTEKKAWTPPQRKMMDRATRYHTMRAAALGVFLVLATVAGLVVRGQIVEQQKEMQAAGLVKRLIDADPAQVPDALREVAAYRRWADPLLRQENDKAVAGSRQKLHASLALVAVDAGQVDYLYGRLLTAEPNEVPVIRDALLPYAGSLNSKLWSVVQSPEKGKEATRLRAAAALAKYDPRGDRWAACGPLVVHDLVRENPVFLGQWSEDFRPVKDRLLKALGDVFRDPQPERLAERNLATSLLADYAADQVPVLADLLMDADAKQFAVIYPKLTEQADKGLPVLIGEIDRKPAPDAQDDDKEKLAKRQANAAVALLRMNQPAKVWPLLKHSPDPRVRSYLIGRLGPFSADPKPIIERLDREPDASIRRALILSLGEFGDQAISPDDRTTLTKKLSALYSNEPDPGLHAAAEWLLRSWKQDAWLKGTDERWAKDADQRVRRLKGIAEELTNKKPNASSQWYVNSVGQTMVVIPGPVEFMMGSPPSEAGHRDDERQHRVRITRTFAVAAKSVTVEEYRKFDDTYKVSAVYTRLPVVSTSWYQAAAYCNWLSKQEGVPDDQWCYEMEDGKVSKLKVGYLGLEGYRLPTEAEMEYATRAGASTSRYYGETDELLSKYAWYLTNSQEKTWPVGGKKPNDFGFSDVYGNVFCWCQEAYRSYPALKDDETIEDKEDDPNVTSTAKRMVWGSAFDTQSSLVRSAIRNSIEPAIQLSEIGFRAARTLRLDRLTALPLPP